MSMLSRGFHRRDRSDIQRGMDRPGRACLIWAEDTAVPHRPVVFEWDGNDRRGL